MTHESFIFSFRLVTVAHTVLIYSYEHIWLNVQLFLCKIKIIMQGFWIVHLENMYTVRLNDLIMFRQCFFMFQFYDSWWFDQGC